LPPRRAGTIAPMHPIQRLYVYAQKYRRDFRLAVLYSVLNKFFDILPEVLIGAAVDVVIKGEESFLARHVLVTVGITDTWQQLLVLGALNIVVWIGESGFEYLLELKWRGLAQNIQHELRLDTYGHVQKLELSYFENQRTGALMSILNDDINQLERFLNGGANQIIQVICSSLMVGAVFFALQPGLALVALLPVPAILLGTFWFQRRLAPRYAVVREAAGDV
jgi:ATP-binding cassette subfamily B protein